MAAHSGQQQQPLALDSAAYGQASGWRKGEDLIDALPYIDPLTPDIKKQVEALIEEEMRSSAKRPADYLKELPPLPPAKFEGHPLLQAEYERCARPAAGGPDELVSGCC
jgi:pre-mRNA-splicing factor SPF27